MEEQGIMSLGGMGAPAPANQPPMFDPAASAAFESARQQIDPREFGTELLAAAEDTNPTEVQQFRQALESMQLPPDVIDALGQMVDAVLAEPQNYQEIRAEFIKEGVPEELLPPEFDAAYFGALNMALDQMSGSMMPMGVQGFAAGGIVQLNPIAQALASQGRNGDRMLAHITPSEARMLRRRGGSGTINPVTGLPEFFLKSVAKAVGGVFKGAAKAVGSVVKGVAGAVKKFASSTVGKVVTAVALGFFLGPAAASMLGVSSVAGVAAVSGFVGGFGSSLLAGQSLKDSLKSGALGGLTAGVTAGVTGGMGAFEAGSYAGPTTVAGQWDRAVNAGKSLLGMPSAQPEVTGTISNVEVSPVQTPTTPTVTELAGQPIAGPQDFTFDPITGEQLLTPAAPPAPSFAPAAGPGGSTTAYLGRAAVDPLTGLPPQVSYNVGPPPISQGGFSFDPVTGEMLAPATPIGPGMSATSLPAPSAGDYLSTGDYQSLMASGQGIPTTPGSEAYFRGLDVPGVTPAPTSGIGTLPGAPTAAPTAATGFQQAPSAMDLYRQGDYFGAAKEAFMPTSYTEAQLVQSPAFQAARAQGATYTEALKSASGSYNPSFIRSYGPTVAAGTLAMGAMGGFSPQEEGPPGIVPKETGFDLMAQSPEIYGTTPGGAATQYFTPQYMGYGLPTRQYTPAQFMFSPVQYYAAPQYQRQTMQPRAFAQGGIAGLKKGGTPKFPRKNGAINGPGTETSDDIPAMLSDGEFVFTAKAVRGMGKGSRRLGAKRMYAMMKALEGKA